MLMHVVYISNEEPGALMKCSVIQGAC